MIDHGLVILGIIIVNISSGLASYIVGVTTTLLRLFLTLYLPFFNTYYHQLYKFAAIAAFVASFGFLVSFFDVGQYFTLILALILIVFLLRTKI